MFPQKRVLLNIIISVFLLSASPVFASDNSTSKAYDNFTLIDYNKKNHSLKDFADRKGIVIFFVSTNCPVSNAYNERMANLYEEFKSNFSFIGINSNKTEDIEEIKEHAKDNSLNFVILKDDKNIIADKFDASFTPEVYVLDNSFEQLYHGRIDDSRREKDVEEKDLRNALKQILKGEDVTVKETKAFGCTIKRVN